MNAELLALLKDWGSAGAAIVVVILFLRYLKYQQDMMRAMQDTFNTIMTNHLEHEAAIHREAAQIMAEGQKNAASIMATALEKLSMDCERRQGV